MHVSIMHHGKVIGPKQLSEMRVELYFSSFLEALDLNT